MQLVTRVLRCVTEVSGHLYRVLTLSWGHGPGCQDPGGGDGVPGDMALGVRTREVVTGSQGTWPWVSGPRGR